MNGHVEERSRVEVMQLGTEHPPATHASATNPTSSFAHCAQIKSTEKLIKIKELRIKYLQDLIEVETFNKDITDAAQLEALIKEKAQTELEFVVRMVSCESSLSLPYPMLHPQKLERA
ncbi:hypothetical protein TNIN_250071 [Trichonephila inaurata madagascariensis]|uniref:Uncharacterized protein n=1 Tax=Trichonephila inaurata madagascariensis TaxID=2747483 RepID=A0A8X6XL85_9ARAC|nr:hypothetical protein TNIN_250071 [Trichonephila inaurata madagascariensis]